MPIEILMPALSPTMEDGTLAKWSVAEGDAVSAGDVIAEIETDKATMEFEAIDDGRVHKLLIAEGTEGVLVNTPIAILLEDGEAVVEAGEKASAPSRPSISPAPESDTRHQAPSMTTKPITSGTRVFASPLARRIAKDREINLTTIKGTGPRGRIVRADVDNAAVPSHLATAAPTPIKPVAATDVAAIYADRAYEEIALDGMRRTIAARLTEAKQTIPHFYLRREIGLDALLDLRKQINARLEKQRIKISVNDFVIKASAMALQEVPACNAVWAGDRILQLKASDISVAVSIDGGLITPVIRDAEVKTLSAISTEMQDLAARARDRKLAPQDYTGGGFSISNLGMMGIENFDAVINPPQGAILAVGAGLRKPVVDDQGDVAVRTRMSVTLSVDHRVIDGALGARLLQSITSLIENPVTMLV